jgi:alkaline phosphatase D
LHNAYNKLNENNHYRRLKETVKIFPIWDDHDYGLNDAGSEYPSKRQSQEIYLNFWGIPLDDDRHNRDGIYFSEEKIIQGKVFKLIFLDTRFFRSKLKGPKGKYIENLDPDATILGNSQWNWLESKLKDQFDFLMIFSSIQIIAEDHPYEKWNNFPHEKEKLFKMLNKYNDKTLFVSGDRHRGGIYKESGIYEITASSLNKPGSNFDETDANLIGKTYNQENYGSLEVSETKINVLLKDVKGQTLNMVSLKY